MNTFFLMIALITPAGQPVEVKEPYHSAATCAVAKAEAIAAMDIAPRGYTLTSIACERVKARKSAARQ